MKKSCFVFGAHAEAVKFVPIIREFRQRNVNFLTVYVGQQQSPPIDDALLRELGMPTPDYSLQHTSWVFNVMDCVQQFTAILRFERPNVVLVQEETDATLVASLAAKAVGVPLLSLKTGQRSDKPVGCEPRISRQIPTGNFSLGILATTIGQPML
jgi:UDP-N-acetylglucosamine 2-epimerase